MLVYHGFCIITWISLRMCFPSLYAIHLPCSEKGYAERDRYGFPLDLGVLQGGVEPRPKRLFSVEVLVEAWSGR